MNKFYGPVGVGIALCMSTALLAQETPTRQPQQPSSTNPSTTRDTVRANTNANEGDQVLVTWLMVDNENEIELSRLALSRATAPEVKQFAQKMVDDHSQFLQKLQQHAGKSATGMSNRSGADRSGDRSGSGAVGQGGTGNTGSGSTGGSGSGSGSGNTGTGNTGTGNTGTGNTGTGNTGSGNTTGTGAVGSTGGSNAGRDPKGEMSGRSGMPQDASSSRSGAAGSTIDHERLLRELGRQCLESNTRLLNEKQGAEFDRCYMGMALAAHVKAVDTLEVFRNHASAGLRPTLDEGLRTVQMHLQHAKDLAKRTDQLNNTTGK